MNPFNWIRARVYEAFAGGMRDFVAEIAPDNPPQTLAEMRQMLTAAAATSHILPPALTGAEPDEPAAKKRTK